MPAIYKATITPGGNKTLGTTFTFAHPDLAVGDILVVGISHDNTASTLPSATIDRPAGETNTWTQAVAWVNPTATSGSGIHGKIFVIKAAVAWSAGTRTVTFSAAISAKVAGGYVIEGGELPVQASSAASHASSTVSLVAPTVPSGGILIWLVGQENTAIGTLGGPISSGTNDTGGATSGGSANTNIAARMRIGGGSGTSTQAGTLDKGLAYVVIPEYVPPPTPAEILDIGPGETQNHFKLVYSPYTGDPTITKTQAEIVAGFESTAQFFAVPPGYIRVRFGAGSTGDALESDGYARAELHEVIADGSADMEFNALTGEHIMSGISGIDTQSTLNDPEVVIAHLHDGVQSRAKFKVLYDGTFRLVAVIDGVVQTPYLVSPYNGAEFAWKIRLIDGVIQFYYSNMSTPVFTSAALTQPAIPDKWQFRVGQYNQFKFGELGGTGNVTPDNAYAEVVLRSLVVSHVHGDPTPPGGSDVQKIYIGDTLVGLGKIYIGDQQVDKIYIGDVLVYEDVP